MHTDEHRNDMWRWVGPAVRRVRLRNYRCIGHCDVELQPLSMIIGRNGAGKSAFLDALMFVAHGVRDSVREAIRRRGGIEAVRRRGIGHPPNFAVELEVRLPSWHLARFGFEIATRAGGGFAIRNERAEIRDDDGTLLAFYLRDGQAVVRSSFEAPPPPTDDDFYLLRAAGIGVFRELHDALAAMRRYRFDPAALNTIGPGDDGAVLAADGGNLASVVARLARDRPADLERVTAYLGAVAPGLVGVERVAAGFGETLLFRQSIGGTRHPRKLPAADLGDGTLHALAVLIAAFQDADRRGAVCLAAIEVPETGLHPIAAPALLEALRTAADRTQLLLTSHSPDLIDAVQPGRDALVVASADHGAATLATLDPAEIEAASEAHGGASLGALARLDVLYPTTTTTPAAEDQLGLF